MLISYENVVNFANIHSFGRHRGRFYILRYGFNNQPCGYVLLTNAERKKYPNVYDFDKVDNEIRMHGGCTYIGDLGGLKEWFIGFDCCHLYDYKNPKTFKFAKNECKSIIDQLIELHCDKQ